MRVNHLNHIVRLAVAGILAASTLAVSACSTLQVAGNEEGSLPANENEQRDYMKAVRRCHKMGGSRVVKIQGELRCF
jgi:hypothetical protein